MDVPDFIVQRFTGIAPGNVLSAAAELAASGRISIIEAGIDAEGDLFIAGSAPGHRSEVVFDVTIEQSGSMYGECDCAQLPGTPCLHTIAAAMQVLAESFAVDAPEPEPLAAWQRELEQTLPEASTASAEICLFFSVRKPSDRESWYGGSRGRTPRLSFRPGIRGARENWIKGNVGWRAVDQLGGRHPAFAALKRLTRLHELSRDTMSYYYYGVSANDWLSLEEMASSEVWQCLRELERCGVPLLADGKSQHPLLLSSDPLDINVTITKKGRSLRLTADAEGVDAAGLTWLGSPVSMAARVIDPGGQNQQITLWRTTAPLKPVAEQLLKRRGAMNIPADQREEFERTYLPRIQAEVEVVSPDASYVLPEPRAAELVLTLTYAAPQLHLQWAWDRPVPQVRDATAEAAVVAEVRNAAGELAEPLLGALGAQGQFIDRTLGAASAAMLVGDVLPGLRAVAGLRIVEDEATPAFAPAESAPVVDVATTQEGDWYDLDVSVSVGGEEVEFTRLFTALAMGDRVFVLPSGTYFRLDGEEFAAFRAIIDEARALTDRPIDRLRVSKYQIDLVNELSDLGMVTAAEAEWWLAVQSLTADAAARNVEPPAGLRAKLRPYQQAGFSWLDFLRRHGLGGVLADDMGLGKTVQTIAMMLKAREEHPDAPPFLVVAPTSVVGNWVLECGHFAPDLRVGAITAMEGRRGYSLAKAAESVDVLVTSYALFRGEAESYRELSWSGLILDEAQQVKNAASHGYRAARTLGAPFVIVITGTPMENNLGELWALVSLAAPGLLGTKERFKEFYGTPIEKQKDAEKLATLQRRMRPFLLRRTKELVAPELPPKQEHNVEIDLHPRHRKLYDVRFQRERQRLLGLLDDVQENRFQIFRSLTLLRQLALDPELVEEGSAPSAKLDALVELLSEASVEGHRVLVLSQFTRFLMRARDRAVEAGLSAEYLDGSTTERPKVIKRFREGDSDAFFVSLKAGGFGLNLVEADYVVLLDPWWNPAVEEQAVDRTHRIGQTKPVFVYRLVAVGTIEEKVIALRESKAALFGQVLDGEGEFGSASLTADDIRELLG